MTDKIKQSEINSTAWAACDTFRSVVDPSQYKDYILVMLFLKYISDVWKYHYEEYRKQYGDDDERIRRRLGRERFELPQGSGFYDLYEARSEANIGERINIALDAIEEANKIKLEGVFRLEPMQQPKRRAAQIQLCRKLTSLGARLPSGKWLRVEVGDDPT